MASNLLKVPIQIQSQFTKTINCSSFSSSTKTLTLKHKSSESQQFIIKINCSLSSSTPTPPTSKEAAILQAKKSLSTTLEKPLTTTKLATTKIKRQKQPRFRLEIPVADDSPESFSQLAVEVFRGLPIKRKGPPAKILIVWPDLTHKKAALKAFDSFPDCPVSHTDIASLSDNNGDETLALISSEVVVFMASESAQLSAVKSVSEVSYPRPVVIFNPKWAFEDESEFGKLKDFVGSFEVIYSFMGLEVKGILSKRKGVIFKCERERWSILVEEENGELKAISSFKARPSIGEVESVLYNLMAVNSPVTKSVRFLKGLVSNITGKKEE